MKKLSYFKKEKLNSGINLILMKIQKLRPNLILKLNETFIL